MGRPKKAPRDRLNITLPKATVKKLRAYAKRIDRDVSEVINAAVVYVMEKEIPPGAIVVKMAREDREYLKANPEG
jgi:hypothetical protein